MLYNYFMRNKIYSYQQKVLKTLSNKINDFYLAGGTALSVFYFQHRFSADLDFFTHKFDRTKIIRIIRELSAELKKPIKMVSQQIRKDMVKMVIFSVELNKRDFPKIDFVEDYFKTIKQPNNINGIFVMSLEDIYLRKISAIVGISQTTDIISRRKSIGGRQEAKDFFDLYYLSHTFMGIASFAGKYCDKVLQENLIRWFRTYNRMEMKIGLMDLKIKKKVNYQDMEKHFRREIGKILEEEVKFL